MTEKGSDLISDSQIITAIEKQGEFQGVGDGFGQLDIKLKTYY